MLLMAVAFLGPAATVSLQTDVEPLHQIMPKLAAATGRRLSHAPSLKWQLNFIRVSDADPNLLLAHVAQANYGRWEQQQDGSQVLAFDEARASRDLAKRRSERAALIRASIKNQLAEKAPDVDDEYRSLSRSYRATALSTRILASLDANFLAGLADGEVVVFSTRATKAQVPFTAFRPEWEAEFRKLENDSRAERAILASRPKAPELLKIEAMLDPAYWEARKPRTKGLFSTQILTEPLTKFDVTCEVDDAGVSCTISGFDEQGLEQLNEGVDLYFADAALGDEVEGKDGGSAIKVSKETARMIQFWSDDEGDDPLRARIKNIRAEDPFVKAYSDILEQYAKTTSNNLVLTVADRAIEDTSEGVTVKAVETWISGEGHFRRRLHPENGWTVSIPAKPPVVINRDTLAEFVERAQKPIPTFEDRAWMAANRSQTDPEVFDWVLNAFGHRYLSLNGSLLKVYGHLAPSDQRRLREGHALAVGALPSAAKRIVARLGKMDIEPLREPSPMEDYIARAKLVKSFEYTINLYPTNVLPQGVPSEATLSLRLKEQDAYLSLGDSLSYANALAGVDGLPASRIVREYAELQFKDGAEDKDPEVTVTTQTEYQLTLTAIPGFGVRELYQVRKPSTSDRRVRFSTLKPSLAKLLDPVMARAREYDAYRKAREAYFGG